MTFFKNMFAHWGITAKLTTLFVLFGFVPMAVVGLIVYDAGGENLLAVLAKFAWPA